MNKHFKFILAGAAIVAGLAGAVSCQDLKGELDNLTNKVNSLEQNVNALETKINGGALVTAVNPIADGIEVVTSQGTYKITNGTSGTNGDTWTIGNDGYWYKNNQKTDYKAVGSDGKNGTDGKDGANGEYYVPNGKGTFDKVDKDGNRTATDISYVPAIAGSVSAVYDSAKGQLILSFLNDKGETVTYTLSTLGELKSLVTVPQAYVEGIEAVIYEHMQYKPLTWVAGHLKNSVAATAAKESIERQEIAAGAPTVDIYPLMEVAYHINPENADLSDITISDIYNANVDYIQTRANASANFKVEAVGYKVVERDPEVANSRRHLVVSYKVTGDAAIVQGQHNPGTSFISNVALEVKTKDNVITSDYVAVVKRDLTDIRIADPQAQVKNKFKIGTAAAIVPNPGAALDEHYRRTFYGMDHDLGQDPHAWIRNGGGNGATAAQAKPNYWANTANLMAPSCDWTVVYNKRNFDLMSVVTAHNWNAACLVTAAGDVDELTPAKLKALGLQWNFEVVRNYGAGDPEFTYQENFIWLNEKGTLDVKVEDPTNKDAHVYVLTHVFDEGNDTPSRTSIGRHPVVRVSLVHPVYKADGSLLREDVVEAAYIKLLFVDADPEVADVTFTFPAIGYRCDPAAEMKTTVEQMNEEIYHAFGKTKIEFHALYPTFDPNAVAGQIGTVIEEVTANPATGATHIIKWTLTPDQIWAIASTNTTDKELTRTCYYKNAAGGAVAVILKTTIKPFSKIFDLDYENGRADYIAEYWIAHKHGDAQVTAGTFVSATDRIQYATTSYHVATPELGSEDNGKCTFVNDINASFVTYDGSNANYPAGTLKVIRDGVALGQVEYFFDAKENKIDNATFVKPNDDINKVEHIYVRVAAADEGANAGLILYAHKGVIPAADTPGAPITTATTPAAANAVTPGFYQPIAVIVNNFAGGVGKYNTCTYQDNALAKELLNTDGFFAYIGAKGKVCVYQNGTAIGTATPQAVSIKFHGKDFFKVDFLRPVSIETTTPAHFIDAVDFGADGSFIRYEDIVRPYDWRLEWNGYDSHFDPNHVNYWKFYGLGAGQFIIHADLAGATTTLAGGAIPATVTLQANDIDGTTDYLPASVWNATDGWVRTQANDTDWFTKVADNSTVYSYNKTTATELKYVLTAADIAAKKQSNYGWLTYNNNGTAVGAFKITVPMVVWYKWGKLTTKVTIDVDTTI